MLLILQTLLPPPPPLVRLCLVVDGVDRFGVVFIAAVVAGTLLEKKSVSKKPPPTAVWVAEPFDPDIVIGLSNVADDVDVAKGSDEPNASKLIVLLSLLRCGVDGDVNRCVAYLLLLLLLSFVGDIIFVSILYAAVGGGTLPLLLCL